MAGVTQALLSCPDKGNQPSTPHPTRGPAALSCSKELKMAICEEGRSFCPVQKGHGNGRFAVTVLEHRVSEGRGQGAGGGGRSTSVPEHAWQVTLPHNDNARCLKTLT